MSTVLQKVPNSSLLIDASKQDALDLAARILGPKHLPKILSGNHPDIHIYLPEGKSSLHTMASMQKMIAEMALPPFEAGAKIFILMEAEKMLTQSANALLKTLEEPNPDSYFFLLTEYPDRLLPTILSRLQPITYTQEKLSPLNLSSYFTLAKEEKWDEILDLLPELEDAERLFAGCMDYAASTKDPEFFEKMVELVAQGKQAHLHNVKLSTVFLHILLRESL